MAASYIPWYVGMTYPSWDFKIMTDAGPDDLTNVDITKFSLYFRNLNGTDTLGTGTFTVVAVYPAEIVYKPTVADVTAVNGSFVNGSFNGTIVVKALYPPSNATTDEVIFDGIPFTITAV